MKKLFTILLLICCLSLTGCRKDAQANDFMKEYAAVTTQVAEKLEAGEVDQARAIFEAKKQSLKDKWDKSRTGLPFQYSAETKKRMNSEPERDMAAVVEAAQKAIKRNPPDEKKIQLLVSDLAKVFR